MTVMPARRTNRAVFWIAAILVASAIAATFLLANDMRNLRRLAAKADVAWFDRDDHAAPVAVAPKPTSKLKRVASHVPARFFAEPGNPAAFVRTWRFSGEALCAKLTEAGVPVGSWQPTTPGSATFQCSNAATVKDPASNEPSFAVTVRGDSQNDLSDVRIKAVIPFDPGGMAVRDRLMAVVTMLIDQSRWLDLNNSYQSVSRLENVAQPAFGAKLTFFHEYNNIRHNTFMLSLQSQTQEQRLASAYFDKAEWLPMPSSTAAR